MSVMKNKNLITLFNIILLGCAFGLSYSASIYENGWSIHIALQLFASLLLGLSVQKVFSISRYQIPFVILLMLGSLFDFSFHILNVWIGFRLGLSFTKTSSGGKHSAHALLFSVGMLVAFIPNQHIGIEAIFIVGTYLLLPHSQVSVHASSGVEPFESSIISRIVYGTFIGMIFFGLWNQQSQITEPQATHLFQSFTCFIVFSCLTQTFLSDSFSSRLKQSSMWLPILIWPFMGFGSIQPWDGEVILQGSVILSGIMGLFAFSNPPVQAGFAISLMLSNSLTDQITELHCLTALSLLWLVFEGLKPRTILAFVIASFCIITNRGPVRTTIPVSKFAHFQNDTTFSIIQESWSNDGWIEIGQKNQMSKDVTISPSNIIFIENIPVNLPSRRWKNETSFAKFVQNLLPDAGQIAIFNDISGLVNMSFGTAENIQIEVHTPNTTLTRFIANQYADRKSHWLKPNRQLIGDKGYHPNSSTNYEMIIESIHHPWQSSISNGFATRHFEHISASLSDSGMAAFIVHLNSVPRHGINVLAAKLEGIFNDTLYVIPKDNIDSLLILCSKTELLYSDLSTSLQKDEDFWMGQIVLRDYPLGKIDNIDLSPQNAPPIPLAHLTELKDVLPAPTDLWNDLPKSADSQLQAKFEDHKEYLTLLTAGMSGTLQTLQQTSLPPALTANLTEPHIQSAKKHIRLAQAEGQSSAHWGDAQRYALTAQLIAPKDTEPWLLLGDIAIGEGFIEKAKEKYTKVLELDPTSIEAINGLARAAGLQNNTSEVKSLLLKAKELEPGNWITTYNLATFILQEGEVDTALNLFQSTLELPNGDNEKTRVGLVECYIANESWTRGLLEIDRLIQTTPSPSAILWYLRGRIHFGLDLWEKAEVDFRKATLEDPQFHAARGSIGLIKIAQGDLEGAAQAFRSTLRFDPNNETARKNLQQVLEQLNASQ